MNLSPKKAPEKHVLILENDRDFGIRLLKAFQNKRYGVSLCCTAKEALQLAETSKIDLLLTDYLLDPPDSGLVVAKKFSRIRPDAILVLMSAIDDYEAMYSLCADVKNIYFVRKERERGRLGSSSSPELLVKDRAYDAESVVYQVIKHLDPKLIEVPRAVAPREQPASVTAGDLVVKRDPPVAALGSKRIELSPRQFKLLWALAISYADDADRYVSMSDLICVWKGQLDPMTEMRLQNSKLYKADTPAYRATAVAISALRKKIDSVGRDSGIVCMHGTGCKLVKIESNSIGLAPKSVALRRTKR
jgi:DNA-binding response OmpR family regulator